MKPKFIKVKDNVDLSILLTLGFIRKPSGIYVYTNSDTDVKYELVVNTTRKVQQKFRVISSETVGMTHYLPNVLWKLFINNMLEEV